MSTSARRRARVRNLSERVGDICVDGHFTQSTRERWKASPGRKVLVMGNHDVAASGEPVMDGMDQVIVTLLIPGRPHLFLTHQPLESVPAGTVNVHGRTHDKPSPTTDRHLNVSVEQLHYQPVRLEELEGLAGHPTNAKLIGTTAERVKEWRQEKYRHRPAQGESDITGTIEGSRP